MAMKIEGVICAMVTPMEQDGHISRAGTKTMVDHIIARGVDGVFALGTTGEFFSLSTAEKVEFVRTVMEAVAGRVPVYAGAGAVSTGEAVMLARSFEQLGVDALSVVTPFYISVSQREMIRHYEKLASSTRLPIVLYNIPARTGVRLDPETVGMLAKIDNIAGIKDSSGDFGNMKAYLDCTGDDFAVLAGNDSLILPGLKAGAKGTIAATSNVVPAIVSGIYRAFREGRMEDAEGLQRQLQPLRDLFGLGTIPSILKECANLIGLPAGPCREPLLPPAEPLRKTLRDTLLQYYKDEFVG